MALSSIVGSIGLVGLGILAYCGLCIVVLLFADIPNESPYTYVSDVLVLVTLPFIIGFSVVVSQIRS